MEAYAGGFRIDLVQAASAALFLAGLYFLSVGQWAEGVASVVACVAAFTFSNLWSRFED
ncbi:MAG: hypothetical protein V1787_01300 [Candidatus Micrarchaeota archaeon]